MARIKEHNKDELYREYVTEALKMIASNTAKFAGGDYMKVSYRELSNPKPVDNRSADEIISHIKSQLGGEQS